jgi:hypothetical protein
MEYLKLKTLSYQVFLDLQFYSQITKQQLPEEVKEQWTDECKNSAQHDLLLLNSKHID